MSPRGKKQLEDKIDRLVGAIDDFVVQLESTKKYATKPFIEAAIGYAEKLQIVVDMVVTRSNTLTHISSSNKKLIAGLKESLTYAAEWDAKQPDPVNLTQIKYRVGYIQELAKSTQKEIIRTNATPLQKFGNFAQEVVTSLSSKMSTKADNKRGAEVDENKEPDKKRPSR